MIRVAGERVNDLFGLAEAEAFARPEGLADRYVALARKVGMRYNVRLLPEYREVYCRRCSAYWVEGRTVRTRLRNGHRVRTCLRCGRPRRVRFATRATPSQVDLGAGNRPAAEPAVAEVSADAEDDDGASSEEDA